jgi:hypothetical protein
MITNRRPGWRLLAMVANRSATTRARVGGRAEHGAHDNCDRETDPLNQSLPHSLNHSTHAFHASCHATLRNMVGQAAAFAARDIHDLHKPKQIFSRCRRPSTSCIMDTIMASEVRILYRPVGPKELALIEASGYRAFPSRLPAQPIFYPVTNEDYARHIAERWNVRESGSGFVTRFSVREDFIRRYPIQQVGARIHTEYWIPAEELAELNANIVGTIEVIAEFGRITT